jgi:hypothetical protein
MIEFNAIKDGNTLQMFLYGFLIGELSRVNLKWNVIALNSYQMESGYLRQIADKLDELNGDKK